MSASMIGGPGAPGTKVHPRFQTPTNATIWMGILSVAFYYGLTTCYACAIYYRHWLTRSARNLLFMGILPVAGGVVLTWAFVQSVVDLSNPENSYSGVSWFGISVPLAITIASLVLGLVLMVLWWMRSPAFFRTRPEASSGEAAGLPA
jgi:hypothetical protein